MNEKVKLLKEVATTIEILRMGLYDPQIVAAVLDGQCYSDPYRKHVEFLREDFDLENISILINALLIGYEVEGTPEEALCGRYTHFRSKEREYRGKDFGMNQYYEGKADGVIETLETLGIQIKGVNA